MLKRRSDDELFLIYIAFFLYLSAKLCAVQVLFMTYVILYTILYSDLGCCALTIKWTDSDKDELDSIVDAPYCSDR